MPFGVIGRTGPEMRHVVRYGDRSTRRGTFGGEFARAIVTNGDFTAYVCDSAATRPSSQITLGGLVIITTIYRPTIYVVNAPQVYNVGRLLRLAKSACESQWGLTTDNEHLMFCDVLSGSL